MFKKKKIEDNRFRIKTTENIPTLGTITILVDQFTGVNYLQTWIGSGSGITPLLDEKGQVVVDVSS
ncbi:DUF6440 family protein [Alkalicoccobacillus plakortidis]|uniref:DUF6440 family protein n=1 Tax=Alkalicoccobacillus plakortidis TaxID=444060 RepID=A0ABT0XPY1_9BACI|nr:DUF6440 family protein [Alkalicoccobacillus plakortidis]MCM2677931.1 DUF6440 family protein [Alkalicoccobacillus plakortidis]